MIGTEPYHRCPSNSQPVIIQCFPLRWNFCSKKALELFKFGSKLMDKRGLILVDTKLEMGFDDEGNILLIDEVLTLDSSRFWIKNSYNKKFHNNEKPEFLDKEIIRRYVKNKYENPYEHKEFHIPDDFRQKLSLKYLLGFHLVTGNPLKQTLYV